MNVISGTMTNVIGKRFQLFMGRFAVARYGLISQDFLLIHSKLEAQHQDALVHSCQMLLFNFDT